MSLAAGTRLGHYEILAQIGAGGMGEVYRARDTRLSRLVALKLLASGAIPDPALRLRFEREAHAVAQISHPHICSLYDVGRDNEIDFLVMELIEGETLAARLDMARAGGEGALDRLFPIEDVLRHAVQIADALEAAHRRGIVHRDLKPANIMLTRHGVKVVDFGLARIIEEPSVAPAMTTASLMTKPGTVFGTVPYMAPEQIEGKAVDGRADIFAFGATLYEMCSGRRTFEGSTAPSVLAAVLTHRPPPPSATAPAGRSIPRTLDRIIGACLEKDPEARWQSAGDLARELRWVSEEADMATTATRSDRRSSRVRESAAWVVAVAAIAAAALVWMRSTTGPAALALLTRITLATPPALDFPDSWLEVAAAPDGRSVVFVGARQNVNMLWIRTLDNEKPRTIEGTEDARSPFWSPDGRYIGFAANGKLWKTTATTAGPIELITDFGNPMNGSWTLGDEILFEDRDSFGIYRVGAGGGQPALVIKSETLEGWPMWPHALPDGQHFIYFEQAGANRGSHVASLDGSTRKPLVRANSRVEYAAAAGYLLFVRDGALLAQRFDLNALEPRGDPVAIAAEVNHFDPLGSAQFSVSPAGVLALRSGLSVARLTWLDRTGLEIAAVDPPLALNHVNLSPNGTRAAVDVKEIRTGTEDLWIYDLERNIAERITATVEQENLPIWSPDGRRLAFTPDYGGPPTLWVRPAAGGIDRGEILLPYARGPQGVRHAWSWHPDGSSIVYSEIDARRNSSIWMLPLDGSRTPVQLLGGGGFYTEPMLSPDGRWLAFTSGQSGRQEIHVQEFPRAKSHRQLTTGGGRRPRWVREGKTLVLFYLSATHLMAIRMSETDELRADRATPVFRLPPGIVDYDVAPDGKRFLAAVPVSVQSGPTLSIVLNWTSHAGLQAAASQP